MILIEKMIAKIKTIETLPLTALAFCQRTETRSPLTLRAVSSLPERLFSSGRMNDFQFLPSRKLLLCPVSQSEPLLVWVFIQDNFCFFSVFFNRLRYTRRPKMDFQMKFDLNTFLLGKISETISNHLMWKTYKYEIRHVCDHSKLKNWNINRLKLVLGRQTSIFGPNMRWGACMLINTSLFGRCMPLAPKKHPLSQFVKL